MFTAQALGEVLHSCILTGLSVVLGAYWPLVTRKYQETLISMTVIAGKSTPVHLAYFSVTSAWKCKVSCRNCFLHDTVLCSGHFAQKVGTLGSIIACVKIHCLFTVYSRNYNQLGLPFEHILSICLGVVWNGSTAMLICIYICLLCFYAWVNSSS